MVRVLRSSILAFLLAAVVMTGVGCRISPGPAAVPRSGDVETSAQATEASTPQAAAPPVAGPGAADATQPRIESLDATQAKALEAELKAIERELDQLDLPSDADFSGIESELP